MTLPLSTEAQDSTHTSLAPEWQIPNSLQSCSERGFRTQTRGGAVSIAVDR